MTIQCVWMKRPVSPKSAMITITRRVAVIDSHTGGEPTRVVVDGGPNLGNGSLAERREVFRNQFDEFRSAVVNEPRGSDVLVGALLQPPTDPSCAAGVIFFNNTGYLNMCGHGAIGVVTTLAYLNRIEVGEHRLETPVGIVTVTLHADGRVTVDNVPCYRHQAKVRLELDGIGAVTGDIAWGGNWFFLVEDHGQEIRLANLGRLSEVTRKIHEALVRDGITGADGGEIDHIELFGPPQAPHANAKNFVQCPGMSYDRSPCGTGTSAKVACLFADGKLKPGEIWRQESIIGSIFEASATVENGKVIPRITGSAYVTAESTQLWQQNDPYQTGIRQ